MLYVTSGSLPSQPEDAVFCLTSTSAVNDLSTVQFIEFHPRIDMRNRFFFALNAKAATGFRFCSSHGLRQCRVGHYSSNGTPAIWNAYACN
jgi:hypothetical protein